MTSLLPAKIARALALTVVLAPQLRAMTDAEAAAGREIARRGADAVVGVEMVVTVKMSMGDRALPPRENRVDVNGTTLNARGLTVTSLAAIDPRVQFEAMRGMLGPQAARMEIGETDYKEVKLRLADGSEVPARVVLKDADTDLAFIAPEGANSAAGSFSPVKLAEPGNAAMLDTCFLVTRAPKGLRWVPIVRPSIVMGIVDKPRRLLLLTDQQIGSPAYDLKGRVVGVCLQHTTSGRPAGLVCMPIEDIAEIAKQAEVEAAKPPPPAAEATTTPAAPADQPAVPGTPPPAPKEPKGN
ncbi:MAG TPA: serine protease [Lacunisphaera sp.]|nr:serine protease [Lacunisphaera sp.]